MSILLEALRKSEKGQRPVEAPTIHQEEQGAPESVTISRGPLILLLVAALIVIAWLVWRQYQPSEEAYQPPVTLPASKPAQTTTPVEGEGTPDLETAETTGANKSSGGQRTPVESYKQPVRVATAPVAPRPDGGVEKIARKNKANAKQSGQSGKQSASASKAGKTLTRPKSVVAREEKASQSKTAQNKGQANDKKTDFKPQEPAPISYWELPDSVRADIPEIKFSVLVYADEPADRFVLSNGQRLNEGDSYEQGLVVEEIRREGVVFSYRLYRFLVER